MNTQIIRFCGHAGLIVLAMVAVAVAEPTTKPAAKEVDYYALTPEQFAALPELRGKLPADPKAEIDVRLLNAAVFHATNVARVGEKLPPLKHSELLEQAAQDHSVEMGKLNYFSHESPVREHRTVGQRISAAGFTDQTIAENIAVRPVMNVPSGRMKTPIIDGQPQPPVDSKSGELIENYTYADIAHSAVDGLMRSPGHRANILNPAYVYLGCGAARGPFRKQDSVYFTQDFGGGQGQ